MSIIAPAGDEESDIAPPTPSPAPAPSTDAELRAGVLSDHRYRDDTRDLFERGRNVVRFVEKHFAEFRGKLVATGVIVDEIRVAVPTTIAPFTDLGLYGLVIGVRFLNLKPEKHRSGSTHSSRTYLRFDDALLARCREWVRLVAQRETGDFIG